MEESRSSHHGYLNRRTFLRNFRLVTANRISFWKYILKNILFTCFQLYPQTDQGLTIQRIKQQEVHALPHSPRKSPTALTCGILAESALKMTKKNSNMFTMMLCDENISSTIKAVCFYEDRYKEFEVSSTYVIQHYKIKKMGSAVEIHIEPTTKVTKALSQFNIETRQFNLAQILRGETGDTLCLHITVKVIHVAEIENVGADQIQKREIQIADESASSSLVLWRDSCTTFSFQRGDVIYIKNATTSNFNNVVHLTISQYTSIQKVEQEMNVAASAPPKGNKTSCNYVS